MSNYISPHLMVCHAIFASIVHKRKKQHTLPGLINCTKSLSQRKKKLMELCNHFVDEMEKSVGNTTQYFREAVRGRFVSDTVRPAEASYKVLCRIFGLEIEINYKIISTN